MTTTADMNRLILQGATKGERRLRATPQTNADELHKALAALQGATGDIARKLAEQRLDRLVADARAARTPAEQSSDFDWGSGIRNRPNVHDATHRLRPAESANALMRRALAASQIERRERGAEQNMIVRNI